MESLSFLVVVRRNVGVKTADSSQNGENSNFTCPLNQMV